MPRKVLVDMDMGGVSRITNLPDAVAAQQPATFAQLTAIAEGIAWKASVRVSTPSNVNLSAPGGTLDGVTLANGDRVLVRSQTAPAENGIYVFNGAASPLVRAPDSNTAQELKSASVTVEEGTTGGSAFRQTATGITVGTTSIVWATFGASSPPASDSTAGLIATATQSEVDAGSVTNKAVTPASLASYSGKKLKYAADIGDGTSTLYTLTHNFNTRDVQVEVYRNTAPWDTVLVDVDRSSVNAVRITFAAAPTNNAYRVVVLG